MKKIKKIWRKLPKEQRLNIPSYYFDIDEKDIKKIRSEKDSKQRLLKAAKIQYELFKDIHTDLTSWIARYASDAIVRQKFGSSKKLREKFCPPIDYKNLCPSWIDIKKRIKIPNQMDSVLAEETGIHLGDGNLHIEKHIDGSLSYDHSISGNLVDEIEYHEDHITNLLKKIYNFSTYFIKYPLKNSISTKCSSKIIVQFKNLVLGLPVGNKKNAEIPKEIIKNSDFVKKCLVGIFDTDFSLEKYQLRGSLASMKLLKQIHCCLNQQQIPHTIRLFSDYGLIQIRKEGTIKIIEEWQIHNQKHLSKYQLYDQLGLHVPFSTTVERQAILSGELDQEELSAICEKRKKMAEYGRFPS